MVTKSWFQIVIIASTLNKPSDCLNKQFDKYVVPITNLLVENGFFHILSSLVNILIFRHQAGERTTDIVVRRGVRYHKNYAMKL